MAGHIAFNGIQGLTEQVSPRNQITHDDQAGRIGYAPIQSGGVSVLLFADAPITQSGVQVIDSTSTSTGDRVLCAFQADARLNGVWEADNVGAWTQIEEWMDIGTLVFIEAGVVYSQSIFKSVNAPITYGVDDLLFTPVIIPSFFTSKGEIVSSNQAITSTSFVNVSDLTVINLQPNTNYAVELVFFLDNANFSNEGWRYRFVIPSGSFLGMYRGSAGVISQTFADGQIDAELDNLGFTLNSTSFGVAQSFNGVIQVGSTGGNLNFQLRKVVNDIAILAGSYIKLVRI